MAIPGRRGGRCFSGCARNVHCELAVLVRDAAEADLEQARSWYNKQRAGLGDEFLVSIAEAFTRLEQEPERYRVLYKGFRRMLVERFPYRIFYQLKGNDVIVFRVLHHARDYLRQL